MSQYRTWVEINKQALRSNVRALGSLLKPETTFCAVVKANAYGHGLEQVISICNALTPLRQGFGGQAGVTPDKDIAFAVDNIDGALRVRELSPKSLIIVLGYTLHERLIDAIRDNIELTVYDLETLQLLEKLAAELNQTARVHLKLETGTHRQGVLEADLPQFLKDLRGMTSVSLSGVSTHFANIEDTSDDTYAMHQLEQYNRMVDTIRTAGFDPKHQHTACSAATTLYPETHGNLVRAGIAMYGFWPSKETRAIARHKDIELELKPVLSWKTRIAQIKNLPKDTPIGYGLTEQLHRESKVATIPVGYWDGFDRGLSSIGEVLVNGTRCKIIGRVCMNMCMIDITDAGEVKPEDEVVLIGEQGSGIIKAEELADKLRTIHYEVVTRINPILPRVVV